MICTACHNIFHGALQELPFHALGGQKLFKHREKPSELEKAAADGCQICVVIWDRLTEEERELVRNAHKDKDTLFSCADAGFYGWCMSTDEERILQFHFGSLSWKVIRFAVLPGLDPSFGRMEFKVDGTPTTIEIQELVTHLGEDTAPAIYSADSFDSRVGYLPLMWSSICNPTNPVHLLCHRYIGHAGFSVPKRLIDVAATDSSTGIRLSLGPEDREELAYVTLSYHWGPNPELDKLPLLTDKTINKYSTAIELGILPKIFQDAIDVTRRMGFRYIWIDALCIIQGDETDWKEQTAVMGEIYMNGYLNIAAGGAKSCHENLFHTQDPAFVAPCKIDIDPRCLKMSERTAGARLDSTEPHYVVGMGYTNNNIMNSPLNRRAWVVQERQLSPRILHFGKHQLFWECRAMRACVTFPFGLPTIKPFALSTGVHRLLIGTDAATMKEHGIDLNYQWFEILELYSTCSISRNSDRLVALSSLARYFGSAAFPTDTYIVGFWKETLIYALLWTVLDGTQTSGEPCKRIKDGPFPTWSWASLHGKITLRSSDAAHWSKQRWAMTEILETKVVLADILNPHGHILDAWLKVRGCLLKGDQVKYMNHDKAKTRMPVGGAEYFGRLGSILKVNNIIRCLIDDLQDFEPLRKFGVLSNRAFFQVPGVFYLPLTYIQEDNIFDGLILMAATGDNKYRRIGSFNTAATFEPQVFIELPRTEFILV